MELVIKLDDETYKEVMDRTEFDTLSLGVKVIEAVQNGRPLPKGHGDLIDANETISKICGNSCGCHLEECGRDIPCYSVTRIKSASTVIEADKEYKE